mgnify:CR=1 FL=1
MKIIKLQVNNYNDFETKVRFYPFLKKEFLKEDLEREWKNNINNKEFKFYIDTNLIFWTNVNYSDDFLYFFKIKKI